MPNADHGNPRLIRQHKEKGEMGDRVLAQKPGRTPTTRPDPKDRTPPRKDDPEPHDHGAHEPRILVSCGEGNAVLRRRSPRTRRGPLRCSEPDAEARPAGD